MNISGNYDTTDREVGIVVKIFDEYEIEYKSISKYAVADDGDVLVILPDDRNILIEVKEEDYKRFSKYGDLGIDFISAFNFKHSEDVTRWKGAPKSPARLQEFLSSINVTKWGKLTYSKSHLWLFFVTDPSNKIVYHAFFDGNRMTSEEFKNYLYSHCLFAVNNKPYWQLSHGDSHHSACFFINNKNEHLNGYKVDLTEYIKKA